MEHIILPGHSQHGTIVTCEGEGDSGGIGWRGRKAGWCACGGVVMEGLCEGVRGMRVVGGAIGNKKGK